MGKPNLLPVSPREGGNTYQLIAQGSCSILVLTSRVHFGEGGAAADTSSPCCALPRKGEPMKRASLSVHDRRRMRMTPMRRAFLIGAALFVMRSPGAAADALCGNGIVEPGEDCDDGGICIGGIDAGTQCTSESQCQRNGVCIGGARAESGCADDSACTGGACVRCRTFGGDGCATNCTVETTVVEPLFPGDFDGGSIVRLAAGTSGTVLFGNILTVPLRLEGTVALTVGKAGSDGRLPVVVKADAVRFSRVPLGVWACGCVRGVARKTCGGTLFDADGNPSLDCTPSLTAGDSVCAGRSLCTSVHGDGNAMAGVIGCAGLDFVDYRVTQDTDGVTGKPGAPQIMFSGSGGPGSAVIFGTTATSGLPGFCSGSEAEYGPDREFCTADDPPSSIGVPITVPFTTGSATAEVFNANPTSAYSTGPFSATGTPLNCESLSSGGSSGGTIVAAATLLGLPSLGGIALTDQIVFQPGAPRTPRPTPPPALPCGGDCDGDGAVTVNEIVRMVNIALNGDTSQNTCPGSDQWCNSGPVLGAIGITCLIDAVNDALGGCPTVSPTPRPTLTPAVAIHYRLVAGRTILSSPAPAGTSASTLEEPLSGTFVAVPLPGGGRFCLNTIVCLGVTTFGLQSAHFTLTPSSEPYGDSAGIILQTTFAPDEVYVGFASFINGQPITLGGGGAFVSGPYPPGTIEMCGAPAGIGGSCAGIRAGTDVGYDIMIFAVPEG